MNYISVLGNAVCIYPIVLMVTLLPYAFIIRKKKALEKGMDLVVFSLLVLYLTCMLCLVLLPMPDAVGGFEFSMMKEHVQLTPFKFVEEVISNHEMIWFKQKAFYQMAFNVLMFIPLGMFMKFWKNASLKQVLCVGFALSLTFEVLQLTGLFGVFAPYRLFDVDDLIVNTLGAFLGALCISKLKLSSGNVLNILRSNRRVLAKLHLEHLI